MVRMMNRSIDILEELAHESGNVFNLNRRGYLFATADPGRIPTMKDVAEESASLGAGPIRYHRGDPGDPTYVPAPAHGFEDLPVGADLLLDRDLIREHFPYLARDTVAVLHSRRCGWLSAQQLGAYLLKRSRAHGLRLEEGRVEDVRAQGGRVIGVQIRNRHGTRTVTSPVFVNAAGPMTKKLAAKIGVDLPVYCELHASVAFKDHLGALPREAPLMIWMDPIHLPWTEEEKDQLEKDESTKWLLEEFPAGVHARPEGPEDSPIVLILWTYHTEEVAPIFPPKFEETYYPEIGLRGMSRMIPGLKAYFARMPRPLIDGGYYTKTAENRPLICPLPIEGAFVIGALSGFGIMASPAAGELLAVHVLGSELPDYARWFDLNRYKDPVYRELLKDWQGEGQL